MYWVEILRISSGNFENVNRWHMSLQGIVQLAQKFPISDVRGRGLMIAVEFGGPDGSLVAKAGTASAITKAAAKRNMLLLSAGMHHHFDLHMSFRNPN